MKPNEIRSVFLDELSRIAPDCDPSTVDETEDLRNALDIDSMDILNLVAALHERLGVDIPEADTGRLTTIEDAIAYLSAKLPGG